MSVSQSWLVESVVLSSAKEERTALLELRTRLGRAEDLVPRWCQSLTLMKLRLPLQLAVYLIQMFVVGKEHQRTSKESSAQRNADGASTGRCGYDSKQAQARIQWWSVEGDTLRPAWIPFLTTHPFDLVCARLHSCDESESSVVCRR